MAVCVSVCVCVYVGKGGKRKEKKHSKRCTGEGRTARFWDGMGEKTVGGAKSGQNTEVPRAKSEQAQTHAHTRTKM